MGFATGAGGGAAAFPWIAIGKAGEMMPPEHVSISERLAAVPFATPMGPGILAAPALNATGFPIWIFVPLRVRTTRTPDWQLFAC
jgi:hypothetical protein